MFSLSENSSYFSHPSNHTIFGLGGQFMTGRVEKDLKKEPEELKAEKSKIDKEDVLDVVNAQL